MLMALYYVETFTVYETTLGRINKKDCKNENACEA